MTVPTKYIKAPVTGNLPRYVDEELRKIESTFAAQLEAFFSELDMSTELGVWSPVLEGATTAGVGTYTTQSGRYWKRDRLVVVQFRVETSGHTGTGQARINNLPFPVAGDAIQYYSAHIYSDVNSINGSLAQGGQSRLAFFTGFPNTGFNIVAAMQMVGSLTYVAQS